MRLDARQLRNVFEALYLDAIVRSLLLSAIATLACLLIGFPVALHDRACSAGAGSSLLLSR